MIHLSTFKNELDMKKKSVVSLAIAAFIVVSFSACNQCPLTEEATDDANKEAVVFKDYGAEPLVLDIEEYTVSNDDFRITLWTGSTIQLTLMSIPVGGEIGLEQHVGIEQFLRVEKGKGVVYMGDTEENLDFVREVGDDMIIMVPSGKWHNIVNTGDEPLKMYSIYGPAEHPRGTVHKTAADDPHHP